MGQEQPQADQSDSAVQDAVTVPTNETRTLIPDGATRFRRYCLGFFDLISGFLTAWITVVYTVGGNQEFQDYQTAGTFVPAGWIATVVAICVAFGVVALAGILVGIWILSDLKTMTPAPLIAAIVFSATSIVMLLLFFTGPSVDPLKVAWSLLHGLVIVMTIRILRQEGVRSLKAAIRGPRAAP
ncbi:hypothetical protein VUN82_19800 [Micrococcaceae bacterium Sec5.1]